VLFRSHGQKDVTVKDAGELVRGGYTFKGWATSEGSTTVVYAVGATLNVENDINLYAVWEKDGEVVSKPPTVNPPKVTPPVVGTPIVDTPIVDTSVVDSQVVNTPAVDTPIVDEPEVTTTDVIPGVVEPRAEAPTEDNGVIGESAPADISSPASINLFGNDVPLFGKSGEASWALLNLLLAVVGAVVAAFVIISDVIRRRKDSDIAEFYAEDESSKSRTRKLSLILGAVAAVVGIVLFVATEDMSAQMVLVDIWTIVQAVVCAAVIVLGKFAHRNQKDDEAIERV
jgi:uncharacterized repeat protein (TIGR02543 family)